MRDPHPTWQPSSVPVPDPDWLSKEAATQPLLVIQAWAGNHYDRLFDTRVRTIPNNPHTAHAILRSINVNEKAFWPKLKEWGVFDLPALVILVNGVHKGTISGLISAEDLVRAVTEHLQ